MIYLQTGTPGAGKTLFTVHNLSSVRDRPIFYYSLTLTELGESLLTNWKPITEEDVKHWDTFPNGCIFIVDECHKVFPVRGATATVPPFIQALAEHRHKGMDFYLITQHPKDLDLFLRRRVYQHRHFTRQFGRESCTSFEWQGYQDDQPDDYHAKKRAQKTRLNYPKRVYDWYVSAESHSVKKSIPLQIYLIPVLLLLIAGIVYSVFSLLGNHAPSSPVVNASSAASVSVVAASAGATVQAPDTVLAESPRKRTLYKNSLNALIPPDVFKAKFVYLVGVYNLFGYAGAQYDLVLETGETLPVTNEYFTNTGASIHVVEPKCLHVISYQEFDLYTRCYPRDDSPLQDDQQQQQDAKPLNPQPIEAAISTSMPFGGLN